MLVRRWAPQPLVGIALSLLALAAVGHRWIWIEPETLAGNDGRRLLIAVALTLAVLVAERFPIHVHYHTKVSITTIPLYLMAVLLPAPVAIAAGGSSVLLSELLARAQRGSYLSDIVGSTSRWIVVLWAGAWVTQAPVAGDLAQTLLLGAAGVVMLVGDLLLGALEVAAIGGEPPGAVFQGLLHEAGPVEGVQYLVGMVVAGVAVDHVWILTLLGVPAGIIYVTFKRIKEVRLSTRRLLENMADAVDERDPYTGGHSRRVTDRCAAILHALGITGPDAELVITAARVHDIGKIGIPDGILNKPGALTAEERAIMETHAARGAELLVQYPDFARGTAIVRHHHERWDGQGYPDGKAGYAIPLGARVLAVADSFDAMTSDRPYRRGMSVERAVQILRDGRGTQWDPQIVDAFVHGVVTQPDQVVQEREVGGVVRGQLRLGQ